MNTRFDFSNVLKRASTWLGVMALFAGGALGAYAMAPDRAQALFPDWALVVLTGMAVVGGGAVAVATSFKQKSLAKPTPPTGA